MPVIVAVAPKDYTAGDFHNFSEDNLLDLDFRYISVIYLSKYVSTGSGFETFSAEPNYTTSTSFSSSLFFLTVTELEFALNNWSVGLTKDVGVMT